MKLMMVAAAAAMLMMPALAEDTVDTLKPQALETCKKEMGDGSPNPELDKLCGCMVDNIVTVFGDDAAKMLKVLAANLNQSDTAEVAALLGISEDEAKAWLTAADEKMDEVQKACMPS